MVLAISLIGGIALIVMGLILVGKANRMSLSKRDGINFPHSAIIGGKSYLSDEAFRNIMRALALVLIILGIYYPSEEKRMCLRPK